jgi:hypothetical protein
VDTAPCTFAAADALVPVDMDDVFSFLHQRDIGFIAGTLGNAKVASHTFFVGIDFTPRHIPTLSSTTFSNIRAYTSILYTIPLL